MSTTSFWCVCWFELGLGFGIEDESTTSFGGVEFGQGEGESVVIERDLEEIEREFGRDRERLREMADDEE